MYGLKEGFAFNQDFHEGHPLLMGGISIDYIKTIWVPESFATIARQKILSLRAFQLSNRVGEDQFGIFTSIKETSPFVKLVEIS